MAEHRPWDNPQAGCHLDEKELERMVDETIEEFERDKDIKLFSGPE